MDIVILSRERFVPQDFGFDEELAHTLDSQRLEEEIQKVEHGIQMSSFGKKSLLRCCPLFSRVELDNLDYFAVSDIPRGAKL